jgi:hypothetical protein
VLEPFDQYLVLFCRLVVAGVFALSVAGKLSGIASFEAVIGEIVRVRRAARPLAWATVSAEGIVVLTAVIGVPMALPGFVLAILLLAAFSAVLGLLMVRRPGMSCNCFGQGSQPVSGYEIARNAVLLGVAVTGSIPLGSDASASWPWIPAEAAGVLLTGLVAATMVTLLLHLRDIVALLRPLRSPVPGGN